MNKLVILCCVSIIFTINHAAPANKINANIFDVIQQMNFASTCPALSTNILVNMSIPLFNCNNVSIENPQKQIDIRNAYEFYCIGVVAADIKLCKAISKNEYSLLPKDYNELKHNIELIQKNKPENICLSFKNISLFNESAPIGPLSQWISVLNTDLKSTQCTHVCSDFMSTGTNVLCSMLYYINSLLQNITQQPNVVTIAQESVKNNQNNTQTVTAPISHTNISQQLTSIEQKPIETKVASKEMIPIKNAKANINPLLKQNVPQVDKTNQDPILNSESITLAEEHVEKNKSPQKAAKPIDSNSKVYSQQQIPQDNLQSLPAKDNTNKASQNDKKPNELVIAKSDEANLNIQKLSTNISAPAVKEELATTQIKTNLTSVKENANLPKQEETAMKPEDLNIKISEENIDVTSSTISPGIPRDNSFLIDDPDDAEDDLIEYENKKEMEAESILPKDKEEINSRHNMENFDEVEDSNFFSYFMFISVMFIAGYVIYHNKQKIMALLLEGRRDRNSRRRPNTASYRKLNSNLEEAVTSKCSGSASHVIY